jgi:glycosyltransferase involved in cell wall biosynthesis
MARPTLGRLIVHQHNPDVAVAGGISTCISDMLERMDSEEDVGLVGVTEEGKEAVGKWHRRTTNGGVNYWFMPVCRLSPTGRRLVPHSVRLMLGLLKNRARIRRVGMLQVHRVEYALFAKLLYPRVPLAQFIHGDGRSGVRKGSDSLFRLLPWLYRAFELVALRLAAVVIVFSEEGSRRLRVLGGDKVIGFTTWYDPEVFRFVDYEPAKAGQDLRVAWVGRLEAVKDPVLAGEVLQNVNAGVRMSVVGGGSMRQDLQHRWAKELADGRVVLLGELPRMQVAGIFGSSHVSLLTSHFEGSPRALIESLACGCPVVCTAAADPDGLIVDGVNGYRVADRDPVDLAVAVAAAAELSRRVCAESVVHLKADAAVGALLGVTQVAKR